MRVVEKIEWCTGADDWGDDDDVEPDPNSNEENGNVINNMKLSPTKFDNRVSDEEDESNSIGSDPLPSFNNLGIDDKNANCGKDPGAYAVARQGSPNRPSAEIEGGEADVVLIDAPSVPQKDVLSLLNTTRMLGKEISNETVLKSFYISVAEENQRIDSDPLNEHIQELLMEYESRGEVRSSPDEPGAVASGGGSGVEEEIYERGVPIHGDLMFHYFLQRIQENPGQILRYTRDAYPLLIAPLQENVQKCQNCGCDTICEIQILPTLIPKLRLENNEPAPIDFGNVLIFTCSKSCWDTPDKMRFETVVVQQEDLPIKPN